MIINLEVKHTKGDNFFRYKFLSNNSITGIYGVSGAGKTTLLNIISGIERPDSGFLAVNDEIIFDSKSSFFKPSQERKIAYIFQDGRLFPHLTVMQNLNYSVKYLKKDTEHIGFDEVVELLKLENLLNKKPKDLSGGEKQRVAIGRALLSQPKMLLLDEPFSNLDRSLRKQIISFLIKINTTYKIPMIIVSHVIGDILRLTNNLVIIDSGEIVVQGDILSIIANSSIPELIKPHKYLNVIDTVLSSNDYNEIGHKLCSVINDKFVLFTDNNRIDLLDIGAKIKVAIRPDDIAFSKEKLLHVSIQNQIQGAIIEVFDNENTSFCIVNCYGVKLIAEITKMAINDLDLRIGSVIWCLIKTKSLETIYDI